MRIGVFDSGIGGLSVMDTLVKKHPNNEYIYLADFANCPFGEKSEEQLIKIEKTILDFFEKEDVDIGICACGTLSSVGEKVLEEFSKSKKIYCFEMIKGVKEYISKNKVKNVLLLATEATINKGIFKENINEAGAYCYGEACPEFVKILEDGIKDKSYISETIKKHINKYENIGSIVLGCTHYPFLKTYIEREIKSSTKIIDLGECLIENNDYDKLMSENKINERKITIYTTKYSRSLIDISIKYFKKIPIEISI